MRSHRFARRGRGGGTGAGQGGRGRRERGPGGLCRSQPPTGVSHLPHSQIRGRGRWGAGGNRAKENEESTALGLGTRVLLHPHLASPGIHTQITVFTHQHALVRVQAHSCPVSHTELHGMLQDTTAPMAVLLRGATPQDVGVSVEGLDRTETSPHALPNAAVCTICVYGGGLTPMYAHLDISTLIPHLQQVHILHGDTGTQPHRFFIQRGRER